MTNLVCLNDFPNIVQVLLGKHKPDIAPDVGNDLLQVGVLVKVASNSFPDGCVLAHEDHCPATQRDANLLHLFGTYIVHIHKKDFGIFVKKRLEDRREEVRLMAELEKALYQKVASEGRQQWNVSAELVCQLF